MCYFLSSCIYVYVLQVRFNFVLDGVITSIYMSHLCTGVPTPTFLFTSTLSLQWICQYNIHIYLVTFMHITFVHLIYVFLSSEDSVLCRVGEMFVFSQLWICLFVYRCQACMLIFDWVVRLLTIGLIFSI